MAMTCRPKSMRSLRWAVVLAAVLITGCGGSSEEESYPVLFPQYGGSGSYPSSALSMARFDQRYSWSDGESWTNHCEGIIRVLNQEGAAWSGRVERGQHIWGIRERCYASGEIAGVVGTDGSLRFTLTQERWSECTALGPGEYTGHIDMNRFYAEGTTPLTCDDGREATVTEIMSGAYAAPDGTHDT